VGADARGGGDRERSFGAVGEGLAEGDEPVAVAIRRPQESRHQMMRENGGAELVGLLRVLAGGTRGEDGQSLRRAALEGDVELRHRRAALDARDRTRLARSEEHTSELQS